MSPALSPSLIWRAPLIDLIPGHLRAQDDGLPGQPLRRFLEVLGVPIVDLRQAILQLLDDHFVERASPEALPFLAELFGARLLGEDAGTNRAVVAKAIAWRRRRGTLAALEELLSATSRWPIEIDEGFRSLLVTQDARDPQPARGRLVPLWDPIVLGDPLSRRPPRGDSRRDLRPDVDAVSIGAGESLDDALRRIGRADAGRFAVSPRTVDLRGWARPEGVLARSSRLVVVELEGVRPGPVDVRADGRRVLALDPLGRPGPLLWRQPLEETALIPQLTARHEPEASGQLTPRRAAALLTPTALAADPRAVEASGAVTLAIEGVPVIGPAPLTVAPIPLPFVPVGPAPRLRFADPGRLAAGQSWTIELLARRPEALEPIMSVVAAAGVTPAPALDVTARLERAEATVTVRLTRQGGSCARRVGAAGAATWTTFELVPLGLPRSPAIQVTVVGAPFIARLESSPGTGDLRLTVLDAQTLAAWVAVPLNGQVPPDGPGLGLVAAPDDHHLFAVGPDGSGHLGAWHIDLTGVGGVQVVRLDDPAAPARPPARLAPSLALHAGRIYLHGGVGGGGGAGGDGLPGDQALGDLWSLPTSGGAAPWQFHFVRQPQPRVEAALVAALDGLVLLGGQAQPGLLAHTVFHLDLTRPRLTWRALAALPITAERPGLIAARPLGVGGSDGIEVLAWDDSTRPRRLALANREATWTAGVVESAAPAGPPAYGELVLRSDLDEALIVGTPPLPPSQLMVRLASDTHLTFLPALDLPAGISATFEVLADGSSRRFRGPGELAEPYQRGPYLVNELEIADGPRVGVVGRLGRQPYGLHQRILGAAHDPGLLPDAPDVVGLDARSARLILPVGLPPGDLTVSYLVGRGSALGAGCLPRLRRPLPFWEEPDFSAPVPPDLPPDVGLRAAVETTAWISPARAGERPVAAPATAPVSAIGPGEAAGLTPPVASLRQIWADPASALDASADQDHPVLGILGSALLPATRLTAPGPAGFSLVANDFGSTPIIAADGADPAAPALAVFAEAGSGPMLPSSPGMSARAYAGVWLAGLWIVGRTDIVMSRGQVDLRWCTLGNPGELSLAVAGGQHQAPLGRRSLHPVEMELRLYGCQVGVIELPPWVRLVAAGCTFDGGSAAATAIRAPGAEVRLRHCTVRGVVEAGELRASSCAFGGAVRVDRRDLGWIRHSLLRWNEGSSQLPPLHHTADHAVSFASLRPTDPNYLVLAENNGPGPLAAGELGRVPGAHGDRTDRQRELTTRAADNLPIGLRAIDLDRVPLDLARMGRRQP